MRHNPEPMRHIPEEELHAYLDQALSRSQCVEIEHHLAGCHVCRAERDGIAALRDRTTALLVAAAPRRIRPRPFAHLSAAHVERASRRTRLLRGAGWAASVVAAIGLGWGLNQWSTPGGAATGGEPTACGGPHRGPAAGDPDPDKYSDAGRDPRLPRRGRSLLPPVQRHPPQQPPPMNRRPLPGRPRRNSASLAGTSAASEPVLTGVWRTVAWTNSQAEQEEWVPRVDGVPVVQVKQRQAPEGGRPITLVDPDPGQRRDDQHRRGPRHRGGRPPLPAARPERQRGAAGHGGRADAPARGRLVDRPPPAAHRARSPSSAARRRTR